MKTKKLIALIAVVPIAWSLDASAGLEQTTMYSNDSKEPLRIIVRKQADPFGGAEAYCHLGVYPEKNNTIAGRNNANETGAGFELTYSKVPRKPISYRDFTTHYQIPRDLAAPSQYQTDPFFAVKGKYRIDEFAPFTLYDVNYLTELSNTSMNSSKYPEGKRGSDNPEWRPGWQGYERQRTSSMLYELMEQLKNGKSIYIDIPNRTQGRFQLKNAPKAVSVFQECMKQIGASSSASSHFNKLPVAQAIREIRGDGRRAIAIFADPGCKYSKKLLAEIRGMSDITIYTFLYPILGNDSREKAKQVWCSSDRVAAWGNWMLNGVEPSGSCNNSEAIEQNLSLGKELGVGGTPTIMTSDGSRINGYAPLSQIEKAIASARN